MREKGDVKNEMRGGWCEEGDETSSQPAHKWGKNLFSRVWLC